MELRRYARTYVYTYEEGRGDFSTDVMPYFYLPVIFKKSSSLCCSGESICLQPWGRTRCVAKHSVQALAFDPRLLNPAGNASTKETCCLLSECASVAI